MFLKASEIDFEILISKIAMFDDRLDLLILKNLEMIELDIDKKGLYNSKKHFLPEADDDKDFIKFQGLLRDLNNEIIYNSLLLISFSIFEASFKTICVFVQDHSKPFFQFKDPSRKVLNCCYDYLNNKTKLISFNETGLDSGYCKIQSYNQFRNIVAHDNGNILKNNSIPLESQELYNLFTSNKYLSIRLNGQVYINDDKYLTNLIKECKEFINRLIENLKNHPNTTD